MKPDDELRRMEDVARRALPHWALDNAGLELLKHRENAVFAVTDGDRRYALRVHRPGYHSDAALRSELGWMEALAASGIEVPRALPTQEGEAFAVLQMGGTADTTQVDLFDWIEGEQLGSVESGLAGNPGAIEDMYRSLGKLAGRLHNQAESWQPPADFERHAWDEEGLAGEQPLWGRFWELGSLTGEQRRLLEAARERVYADLSALGKAPADYSLIHADFAPENILVDDGRLRLIDFDDAGFGWQLFELVTSLYFILDEPYFDEARDALVAGYREHRALPDEKLELLPLFFLARSFTYVGWVHTRPDTETAKELTPMLVEASCSLAHDYLSTE